MSSVVEPNLIKLAIVGAGGVGKSALTVQVRLLSFPFPFPFPERAVE